MGAVVWAASASMTAPTMFSVASTFWAAKWRSAIMPTMGDARQPMAMELTMSDTSVAFIFSPSQ